MALYVSLVNGMGSATDSLSGAVTTTGANDSDFAHLTSDLIYRPGVHDTADTDFAVSAHAPANKSVDVAAGTCYVQNSSYLKNTSVLKYWRVENTATVNPTITDNVSGNPRIDIVCVKIDTAASPDDDASNVASIVVVAGTPAASPAVPATPANYLKLAEVAVANGFTTIIAGNITDRRSNITIADRRLQSTIAFSARRSSATTINDVTFTKIQCNTEEYDYGSCFDSTTNHRFVAPINGLYSFKGVVHITALASGNRALATLYKNGSEFKRGDDVSVGATADTGVSVSVDNMYLAAGEYVELYVYYDGTGTKSLLVSGAQYTYFQGHLIGIV